ncbi:response regulator [Sphingomonas daechungensis]|uniref:Response regulator n=1 Tax=Sphingomonas daechungensis TaxID=1176646 RepID=A0ABX6SYV2_9SPHN|nr:response regulator [Sphingomonas daechungensis]QNP42374.1 response regulator [Sphingomonas daechungensis]
MSNTLPKEVLVVEDEPLVRMVAAGALTDRGIRTWEARDAEEALDVLHRHPGISVVFTDVNMPGAMNGLGLANQVSVIRPDVKLVVTSGAVRIADADLPDHGTFLPKPYGTEVMVDLVTGKLDAASLP